jgi:hypothetical protein
VLWIHSHESTKNRERRDVVDLIVDLIVDPFFNFGTCTKFKLHAHLNCFRNLLS